MAHPTEVARLRDGTAVAGWLLKANPSVWDVGDALRSGADLDQWRLAPSYRVDLVDVGHPVALWVTRGDPGLPAGLWAVGVVTGEPRVGTGDLDDPRWRDRVARDRARPYVEVRLEVLDPYVPAAVLRADPRFAAAEILRAPRVASPVALTPEQRTAVEDHVQDPAVAPSPGHRLE